MVSQDPVEPVNESEFEKIIKDIHDDLLYPSLPDVDEVVADKKCEGVLASSSVLRDLLTPQ